jgi:hypothetical protein
MVKRETCEAFILRLNSCTAPATVIGIINVVVPLDSRFIREGNIDAAAVEFARCNPSVRIPARHRYDAIHVAARCL